MRDPVEGLGEVEVDTVTSSRNGRMLEVQERPGRKPCWAGWKKLASVRWSRMTRLMSFSSSLQIMLVRLTGRKLLGECLSPDL